MIRAVLFDMGYTLLAPHPSFEELVVGTAARHGIALDVDRVRDAESAVFRETCVEGTCFTLTDADSRTFWTRFYHALLERCGASEAGGGSLASTGALADDLYATLSSGQSYAFYPDVLPALARLHERGLRLGVVSNWEGWLHDLLAERDMHRWFDVVVISAHAGIEKPDPGIFHKALDALAVPPGEVVHVGDSLEQDVAPALALGAHPVLIDRRGRHAGASLPCPRIASLDELFSLSVL